MSWYPSIAQKRNPRKLSPAMPQIHNIQSPSWLELGQFSLSIILRDSNLPRKRTFPILWTDVFESEFETLVKESKNTGPILWIIPLFIRSHSKVCLLLISQGKWSSRAIVIFSRRQIWVRRILRLRRTWAIIALRLSKSRDHSPTRPRTEQLARCQPNQTTTCQSLFD